MLLRRSSIVSNSDASCANSSFASGNVWDCTLLTVTSMSASWSFSGPPTRVELKVADSPAESPVTASSNPSSIWPEPTVYSMLSAVASSSGSPSLLATRVIVTMSPSAAGRSTTSREPNRFCSTST